MRLSSPCRRSLGIAGERIVVTVAIADGWATIVIQRIESYAVAVLFGGGTLANLNREADQRRKAWRARIAPGH